MNLLLKNVLFNSFIDWYFHTYFNSNLYHVVANKRDFRMVNTHLKLRGVSLIQELSFFVSNFEFFNHHCDFALDCYEDNFIPLLNFN